MEIERDWKKTEGICFVYSETERKKKKSSAEWIFIYIYSISTTNEEKKSFSETLLYSAAEEIFLSFFIVGLGIIKQPAELARKKELSPSVVNIYP